jgi:hypothetical protein
MKTTLQKNDQQGVSSVLFFGVILALVYLRSKRQVPSTKAANLAIPWLTPTVLLLGNGAPAEVYFNRN